MIKGTVSLHSFQSVLPRYRGTQSDLIEWIIAKHGESLKESGENNSERLLKLLRRFAVGELKIQSRFFETDRELIYKLTSHQLSGGDIALRHDFFGKRALEILEEFYQDVNLPDHLIHVTCTGYLSPSAPQIYFSNAQKDVDITHAYHMGCYASLPAIRLGQALSLGMEKKVDIVHTEMCSLHFDPSEHSPEQMVVQTLFADGHIKYSLSNHNFGRRLEITAIKEMLIPCSTTDMTWIPSPVGMKMTLSKEVPEKIQCFLIQFLQTMAKGNNLEFEKLVRNSLFALHPGGPKIIDSIEKKLELEEWQTADSRKILLERGNMSSATLPHVWLEILKSNYNGPIISLAFGPGLTVFGGIFEARS